MQINISERNRDMCLRKMFPFHIHENEAVLLVLDGVVCSLLHMFQGNFSEYNANISSVLASIVKFKVQGFFPFQLGLVNLEN